MVVTILVISIVVSVVVIGTFRLRDMKVIEVSFRQEVEADVVEMKDELEKIKEQLNNVL